jgi:hypothetical protein
MKPGQLEQLVDALLNDGQGCQSDRASPPKNQRRFAIGCIYPEVFVAAQAGAKSRPTQTECLFCPRAGSSEIEVTVRFLQSRSCDVGKVRESFYRWPLRYEPAFDRVRAFEVNRTCFQSKRETIQREISANIQPGGYPNFVPFIFPAARTLEPIRDEAERVVAVIVRHQPAIAGAIELAVEPAEAGGAFRLTLRIVNRSSVTETEQQDFESVRPRTFASAHAILRAHAAEFISLNDPPPAYAAAATACEHAGLWPVLLGDEAARERDVMLAAPTILPDYPRLVTAGTGSLFDRLEEFAAGPIAAGASDRVEMPVSL